MSEEVKGDASPSGSFLGLCAFLALAAVLGGKAAFELGEWLDTRPLNWAPWGTRIEWATATIGIGCFIALAKDVAQVLVDLPSHAASFKWSAWAGDAVKVFFAVAGCVLAFVTFRPKDPVVADQLLPLLPAYPVVVEPNEGDVLAILPLFYKDNAKKDGPDNDWGTGVALDRIENADAMTLLQRLVERLSARCAPSEPSQEFRLSVVGFASSAEFRGQEASSDDLNLAVSNARAASASRHLTELTKGRGAFHIEQKSFKKPPEMFIKRAYLDRLEGKTTSDQEYLNRRVEVRLHTAGSCNSSEQLLKMLR